MTVLRRHQRLILPCAVPASDKILSRSSDFHQESCTVGQRGPKIHFAKRIQRVASYLTVTVIFCEITGGSNG